MTASALIDRDAFRQRLAELTDEGQLSLGLGDLEDFKAVNDKHGYATGDRLLELVSGYLQERLPDDAVLCRIGGDEFACLLPGAAPEDALLTLEGIRSDLSARKHDLGDVKLRVGIRFGVASYPHHAEDATDLLAAAEQALVRAAKLGGDRVAIYVEDKMVMKSNYYPRAQLDRLSRLAEQAGRTEASLLREALGELLDRNRSRL